MPSEFSGKQRIRIADILHEHYIHHIGYGKAWIQPLPEIVREVFGEERLTQYPVFPQKKLRDFIERLAFEDILELLARLSKDDGKGNEKNLTEQLNNVLIEIGFKLDSGRVLTLAEEEFELPEDEEIFLSSLEKLGYSEIRNVFKDGLKALRSGDVKAASSNCCLAFDGLIKGLVSDKGGNSSQTLGNLVYEAKDLGLIEPDVTPVFSSFVSLRNKAPQHAGIGGSVTPLSKETTLLLIHLGRILMAYLISRI